MRQTQQAFTLIELLVVVAIIAVMASLLLPAIAQGQSLARSTACMSNLRQVGMAISGYTTDHEDLLPRVRTDEGHWFEIIAGYAGVGGGGIVSKEQLHEMSGGVLAGCPAYDHKTTETDKLGYGMNAYMQRPHSIRHNQWLGDPGWARRVNRTDWHVSGLTHLSQRVLVGDHSWWALSTLNQVPGKFVFSSVQPRHRGRLNYVFLDGHVNGLTRDEGWLAVEQPSP